METLYILVKVSHKKLREKKTSASDRKKVVRLMKKKRFNSRDSESRIFGRKNDGLWHLCLTQNYLYNPEVWTVEIILNGYGKSQTLLVQSAEHELWKHSWHLQNFTFFFCRRFVVFVLCLRLLLKSTYKFLGKIITSFLPFLMFHEKTANDRKF